MTAPKPVVLCILDGWGKRAEVAGNAPALAKTPNYDRLMSGATAELITHGPDVGLPRGQMGNSEVGHTNIGAGRVVAMDLGAIDLAIEEGSFFENAALVAFADRLKASGKVAHVMGLVSDGGVHGHIVHIQAALKALADRGVRTVLHAITDGRDVAPKSGAGFMRDLINAMPQGVTLGTVCGRYYAMDRDNRWERVETAYRAIVQGVGLRGDNAVAVIEAAYGSAVTDEFVPATVLGAYAGMADGDGVFCLNFRADRAREILAAMGDPAFDGFDVSGRPALDMLGMVNYSTSHDEYMTTCYPKQKITNALGAWVAAKGLRQFRVAETEKYPHVTFFLNGGIEVPEVREDRYMAPSPKVATYDLQPEMSAAEVTDAFVGAIEEQYDLIVCNYANPDMVGHTGDISAAVKACEAVDAGLGRVLAALEAVGGAMIVTADHGNCETMIDPETGGPHTAHTTNPVSVALVGGPKGARLHNGRLADLAPTLLGLMGLELPPEMTGESLIE
ncbi:2,3-bisphosphoglycerate-independent phosphoglycerate mutase GpmI [Octadecabacter arcticus 238]|uniref:2,3-bisphosphoglycerate-independent phosphoglycerate mutase n=1 Tax=Octadecabacter arcticus 238 TaxID=391616 RepID=M9RF22_9RHOB|nr:2,3-bisphosphoglycerate-independent phosphoglycerate mutase [Octadecabacter arcticus]AGI70343.1 2,3-bisphosphoglycerate-independent phosphoglycerate mutase GpmI [Octadecabacter arcticus 238]